MRMVHRVGRSEGSLGPAGPTPRQEPLSHPSVKPAEKCPKHRSAQLQNQKTGTRILAKAWGRPAAHRAYCLTTNAFAPTASPERKAARCSRAGKEARNDRSARLGDESFLLWCKGTQGGIVTRELARLRTTDCTISERNAGVCAFAPSHESMVNLW